MAGARASDRGARDRGLDALRGAALCGMAADRRPPEIKMGAETWLAGHFDGVDANGRRDLNETSSREREPAH